MTTIATAKLDPPIATPAIALPRPGMFRGPPVWFTAMIPTINAAMPKISSGESKIARMPRTSATVAIPGSRGVGP
ncbi:MAG: hypothetical protein AAGC44_10210 [Planctomycetota bacterium]